MEKLKSRMLNGYRLIYLPDHPTTMTNRVWKGFIYEHIYIAEKILGRTLYKSEVVHHLDGNKCNNKKSNLLILWNEQHSKLHNWFRINNIKITSNSEVKYCVVCGHILEENQINCCSFKCKNEYRRKTERPQLDVLLSDIKNMPMVAVGKKYGVSDNCIRKWIKHYNKCDNKNLGELIE